MAQSASMGPLTTIYERRIGTPTNADEVLGYWSFAIGVLVGILGLIVFFTTDAATMARGVGYALAALALPFIIMGAVLRFPLRRAATGIVAAGGLITVLAIGWFLVIFPEGWSTTVGDTGVIIGYLVGVAIMGIAGVIVPLVTDPRDEASVAQTAELQSIIDSMEIEVSELKSSKADFELYRDSGGEWRWRLRHRNGNVIADSGEGYSSKANARKGLRSVKTNALGAETKEV